jgi:site-specific DNA-methyltransferase (adenine-specific)
MNGVELYNGDCLEIMNDITIRSIDLVIADLPYEKTGCKWDIAIDINKFWELIYKITKNNAIVVMTGIQPFTSHLIMSNLANFRYELIWNKPQGTNPLNAKIMPLRIHENILVFYKQRGTYNPQMWQSTPYSGFKNDHKKMGEVYGSDTKSVHRNNPEGNRYPISILKFRQDKGLHPTQKPLDMMEYLIHTYSNPGDLILDPTMGSGTVGAAAVICGRQFTGIELEPKYFIIAKNRIEKIYKEIHYIDNLFT